jgi:hypothetical protein
MSSLLSKSLTELLGDRDPVVRLRIVGFDGEDVQVENLDREGDKGAGPGAAGEEGFRPGTQPPDERRMEQAPVRFPYSFRTNPSLGPVDSAGRYARR